MQRKDSKTLHPGKMFRSWKARKTRHPIDHLGRSVALDRNTTPPFGRTNNQHNGNVTYFESSVFAQLRSSGFSKPQRCPLCAIGVVEAQEYKSYADLVKHVMEAHTDVHCNNTEFVCTDKMFQVSVEDRDYDELTAVQHGFFMSCEESFSNPIDLYFHFVDMHCLEDTCDICGKWVASRKGCLIDHYLLSHNGKNREITQCPNVCRDNFKCFSEMMRHVIDKHVKVHHVCHVCITSGDSKKDAGQEVKGVFKTREGWLDHCQRAHPGQLVADMMIRGNKVNKSLLHEKIPAMDCMICQRRGRERSGWEGRGQIIVRCKSLQQIVDHIYEDHVGEGFMCWGCAKIRKYTDIKHHRECLFQLSEFFEMRNIRTDKKLWYAFQAKRRGQR